MKKNRFRAIGVPLRRNIERFARELETAMNSVVEEGYDVQIIEQKAGALVLGRLREDTGIAQAVSQFIGGAEGLQIQELEVIHISARTKEIVDAFWRAVSHNAGAGQLSGDCSAVAPRILKNFTVEEMQRAVDDLEKHQQQHAAACNRPDCHVPDLLLAVVSALRSTVHKQLQ